MAVQTRAAELAALDEAHLIHPLYHPLAQKNAIILERGEGVWLFDVNGNRYIDGLSSLWNVNAGHGRRELAEAAAEQMSRLAFNNSYTGYANPPSIQLAKRIVDLAPGDLNAVFFTSGGGESNESAFKMARYYHSIRGKPEKFKIISRHDAYHGVTTSALAATGMSIYWEHFGPRTPGFFHALAPDPYRLGDGDPEACAQQALDSIEEIVETEGADTVAAVIAEPIQGAGGVIIPPPTYLRSLRELCDRHDMLFITDEVITGFGRTGRWFGMEHVGVQPDIMSFAKGVTSGYIQLGGITISARLQEVLAAQPLTTRWMHAYTYSAHPAACAVALANIDLIEREGLVENAARMGERLAAGLREIGELPIAGDARSFGLLGRVEVVADKATKQPFELSQGVGNRIIAALRARGVLTRNRNDVICIAPPLCINDEEMDTLLTALRGAIEEVAREI
jgi:adenosylmethionine-8-amino-7-oxononanoate aminotransferase